MTAVNLPMILGIGCAVPAKKITNDDLTHLYETSDEWIYTRTGIKERRIFSNDTEAFDLLKKAACQALENANISADKIDLIIAATSMPVQFMPSTSCKLQQLLGITKHIPAFDISAACSGFVYGLHLANSYIRAGIYKKILLVTIDNCSRYLDWTDRKTSILFGDGIGAAVIAAGTQSDIDIIDIRADGNIGDYIKMPAQKGNCPFCDQTPQEQICTMIGQDVYKFAINIVPSYISHEILQKNNIDPESIDYLVLHQANQRIVQVVQDHLAFDKQKVISNIERYGNTSASSILIALCEGIAKNTIKTPSKALVCGFGAGMTWGGGVIHLRDGIFRQKTIF